MKLHIALIFIVTSLQVELSQGIQCYICVYKDNATTSIGVGGSSSTCEKNPTPAELENIVFGDENSNIHAAYYRYCFVSKFTIEGVGFVLRGGAYLNQENGATHCDDKLPPYTAYDRFTWENMKSCYCNSTACNGRDISGANTNTQAGTLPFLLLVLSIGLAANYLKYYFL